MKRELPDLRQLTSEEKEELISLLKHAHQKAESAKLLAPHQIGYIRSVYEMILDQDDAAHPPRIKFICELYL